MELIDRANVLLIMDCLDSRDRIEKEVDGLINDGKLVSPTYGGPFLIANPEIFKKELDLAATFQYGSNSNTHFNKDKDLASLIKSISPQLNDD